MLARQAGRRQIVGAGVLSSSHTTTLETPASAVRVVHVPSGTSIRAESERSQKHNLKTARDLLAAKRVERARTEAHAAENARRRDQVGSGMRGDKRRTIRLQADQVVDHVTGRTVTARRYLRGEIDALVAPPDELG